VGDLIVLTGPIGAGKSTVAEALGHRLTESHLTVAIADLDDVAFAQRGSLDVPEFWRRAGVAHVQLVRGWFDAGVDVVVAHGPFFESGTFEQLFATVGPAGRVHHVLLLVSVDVALERVTCDPDRGPGAVSKDPAFLRATHDSFRDLIPFLPPPVLVLDTAGSPPREVAARIAALVV